jgi:predicted RNA binding protein YcfA (HicA-like mRNA interferase family)
MKLRPLKRRELIRKLKKLGYVYDRSATRHYEIWMHTETRKRLPIPNYEEFGVALLSEICSELRIKPPELMEL